MKEEEQVVSPPCSAPCLPSLCLKGGQWTFFFGTSVKAHMHRIYCHAPTHKDPHGYININRHIKKKKKKKIYIYIYTV